MVFTEADMPKAYSYLRFSTPEQSRGDSFRRQASAARLYAERHGLELDESSFEDLGVSAFRGRNAEMGRLGDFLEAVRNGVIDKGSFLLVESLDRLSREKPRKAVRVLEDICEEGITLVTLGDGKEYTERTLDDDPMAFMYAFMIAIRANEESEVKSRRLKAAWEAKRAKAGSLRLTSRAPSWLRPCDNPEDGFELIPEKAAVVQRIFDMASAGKGQHAIAQVLNSEEVPTFGKAEFWHRTYVAKILKNPAVMGTLVPHRIEYVDGKKKRIPGEPVPDYFPAVVKPDVFLEVRSLALDTVSPKRGRHAKEKAKSILGGLARCPYCDGTMTRVSKGPKGGKAYLVCSRAKQGAANHPYKAVPYDPLEEAILDNIDWLAEEAPRPGDAGKVREELDQVQTALDGALEEEERLYRALGDDATQRDKLWLRSAQQATQQLEDQRKDILERLEAARLTNVDVIVERLEVLAEADELDRDAVNLELRKLLSGVTVDYRGHFHRLILRFLGGVKEWEVVYGAGKP